MARFHDESHLNWYFWQNPPLVFEFPFAIREEADTVMESTRVVFIDKRLRGGYDAFRNPKPPPPVRFSLSSSGFRRF
jgi:hypothetical protein